MSREREKVHFVSGGTRCAAWHYPGGNGGCVIMAGGFAVTKEPGTDLFAKRFHEAGFAVLAFDYRGLGESDGQPRQVAPIGGQLADWQAAIEFARTLPGVDPARLAGWAFSVSGGHVLRVAARTARLAAVVAQTPNVDGPAVLRNAARYQTPLALLRLTGRGVLDALGGAVGRPPLLVPLAGERGTVALLATPDAQETDRVLNPENIHPEWQQSVAARSTLALGWYRPGRDASRVHCPLLVVVCDQDRTALAEPAVAVANRAPRAELLRVPGGHYAPFTTAHEQVVEVELSFLRRHLLEATPKACAPVQGVPAERAANEPVPNEPAPNSEHPAAGVPTTPALAAPAAAAAGSASASTDPRG
ncbi:alpha/beta hydrolase [Embleya scabrispora]|uniref:alpha/beta hydrolase n=1 Tax=Embleya scabrispora TaxID=159449 RepID=UPI00035DA0DB|nr:alpha/beta hydrolase [Embleya scabrispora]